MICIHNKDEQEFCFDCEKEFLQDELDILKDFLYEIESKNQQYYIDIITRAKYYIENKKNN